MNKGAEDMVKFIRKMANKRYLSGKTIIRSKLADIEVGIWCLFHKEELESFKNNSPE